MENKRVITFAILTTYADGGGAAKAVRKLSASIADDPGFIVKVITLPGSKIKLRHSIHYKVSYLAEKLIRYLARRKEKSSTFSFGLGAVSPSLLLSEIQDADVIGLFWVNDGFLSCSLLEAIFNLNKPVVWRLSDMWPFTGGCHYSEGCAKYKLDCSSCPMLTNNNLFDITRSTLRKKMSWNINNLHVVCPSKWIEQCSKQSSVFAKANHHYIKTGADLETFFSLDKTESKLALNLSADKFTIGISAADLNEKRKGLDLFVRAIEIIQQRHSEIFQKIEIVFFGKMKDFHGLSFPYRSLGFLNTDRKLNLAYSSLNLFVAPSREENLANTVLEAMASSTPTIGFNIGGMVDVIRNGVNGFIVNQFDVEELADRIVEILRDKNLQSRLSEGARLTIEREDFNLSSSSMQFKSLVRNVVRYEK